MKKIITLLLFLLMLASPVFAYELPRWQFFPVKVYVQDNPRAYLVKEAFSEWEARTNIAKFFYVETEKKIPKIIVTFQNNNDFDEASGRANAVGVTHSYTPRGFYATARIKIFENYPRTNVRMSDAEFYATALHEIGHALGLQHSPSSSDIMYSQITDTKHLSKRDVERFMSIYK